MFIMYQLNLNFFYFKFFYTCTIKYYFQISTNIVLYSLKQVHIVVYEIVQLSLKESSLKYKLDQLSLFITKIKKFKIFQCFFNNKRNVWFGLVYTCIIFLNFTFRLISYSMSAIFFLFFSF